MSSGCGDVLSLADLQTAKKHQIFEAEVITGKVGGVAGGADIDYATNQITGQTQRTLPAVLRDAGPRAASFTFATGGTLGVTDADLAVMWPGPSGNGLYYSWHGSLPKTIPAGSSPATAGGESDTAWKLVGDLRLRQDLASDSGYTLIPSVQIQQWRNEGDIRGWGAVCDGVTDDLAAITAAIAATNGNITIPKSVFVSSHIVFQGLADVDVTFENGAQVKIDSGFIFNPNYRGILEFHSCTDVTVKAPNIVGAKVDKLNAAEPWQDGDAGIEFLSCAGLLHIIDPVVRDVKTWGIIHVTCTDADSVIDNPVMINCQVQSGIGGTGYRSLKVNGGMFTDIGLYGVEVETRARNVRTMVSNSEARLCNKGFASVNNSDNVLFQGLKAINCKTGFSFYSDNSADPTLLGNNQQMKGCVATSCKTSFEIVYPHGTEISGCTEDRDDIDYYTRTRALDRIVRISGGKAYVALDSPNEDPGIAVGAIFQMDDGVQFTVATVDAAATIDTTFGYVWGFTTSTPIGPDYVRSSFRRYVQITTGKTSVVLYGGSEVVIKNNHFSQSEVVFASYDSHTYLIWQGNTTYNCATYFAVGSAGSVTGSIRINKGDNQNIGSLGSVNKFAGAFDVVRTIMLNGGTTTDATKKVHAVPIDNGYIGSLTATINHDVTTTGTPVVRINGADIVVGAFAGSPLRATLVLTPPVNVSEVAIVQLVDTVGDIVTSGYALQLKCVFL